MMLLDLSLGGRHDSAGVAISPRHPVNAGWPSQDKGTRLMTSRSPVRIRSPHPSNAQEVLCFSEYELTPPPNHGLEVPPARHPLEVAE